MFVESDAMVDHKSNTHAGIMEDTDHRFINERFAGLISLHDTKASLPSNAKVRLSHYLNL